MPCQLFGFVLSGCPGEEGLDPVCICASYSVTSYACENVYIYSFVFISVCVCVDSVYSVFHSTSMWTYTMVSVCSCVWETEALSRRWFILHLKDERWRNSRNGMKWVFMQTFSQPSSWIPHCSCSRSEESCAHAFHHVFCSLQRHSRLEYILSIAKEIIQHITLLKTTSWTQQKRRPILKWISKVFLPHQHIDLFGNQHDDSRPN